MTPFCMNVRTTADNHPATYEQSERALNLLGFDNVRHGPGTTWLCTGNNTHRMVQDQDGLLYFTVRVGTVTLVVTDAIKA